MPSKNLTQSKHETRFYTSMISPSPYVHVCNLILKKIHGRTTRVYNRK